MRNKIIVSLFFSALVAAVFVYIGSRDQYRNGIYQYRVKEDLPFVVNLFKQNWYWLIAEGSTFDPAVTFKNLSPREAPLKKGGLSTYIYWYEGRPVGLVAYYMKNFFEGFIWFIVVDEAYRGKGISHKLIVFALDDLQRQGAKSVWLITRLSNEPAQGLYKKVGFQETWRDDGFVKFTKKFVS